MEPPVAKPDSKNGAIDRRSLVVAAAWSVPVIAAAATAPMTAASGASCTPDDTSNLSYYVDDITNTVIIANSSEDCAFSGTLNPAYKPFTFPIPFAPLSINGVVGKRVFDRIARVYWIEHPMTIDIPAGETVALPILSVYSGISLSSGTSSTSLTIKLKTATGAEVPASGSTIVTVYRESDSPPAP